MLTQVAMAIGTLRRGGAEQVLVSLANGLDPARFRVHVITTREPGPLADALGGHVVLHSLDRQSRWDVGALWRFAALVQREGIRLVHAHSHSAAHFVAVARRVARGEWLQIMHDHHGPIERAPVVRRLDRRLLRNVDHYFAVSDRLTRYGREVVGVPAERVECLLNGVPVLDAGPHAPAPVFTIAHVARVEPDKDHATAIDAADLLRDTLGEVHWRCIGRTSSRYAAGLRGATQARGLDGVVHFEGERADVGHVLRTAHVGVLTSRYEGLPLALLEYMSAGLPVVTTDVGQCGAIVRESGAGVVTGPGDARRLAAAVAELARHPDRARAMGAAGALYVRERYSLEATIRRVEAVYERLLDAAPTPDDRSPLQPIGWRGPGSERAGSIPDAPRRVAGLEPAERQEL